MLPPIRVKLVCDGEPWSTRLVDIETGAMLYNVTAVTWTYTAGINQTTATVTLVNIPVEGVLGPNYEWVEVPSPDA